MKGLALLGGVFLWRFFSFKIGIGLRNRNDSANEIVEPRPQSKFAELGGRSSLARGDNRSRARIIVFQETETS